MNRGSGVIQHTVVKYLLNTILIFVDEVEEETVSSPTRI